MIQARKPRNATLVTRRRVAKNEGWLSWVRDGEGEEADERAMIAGCKFDIRRAEHVVDFFEKFGVLTEGSWKGQPFKLLDWQRDWLMRGFGWVRYSKEWSDWIRRFRYLYLEVPKKNGKTPMVATLGNYLLFADSYERQIHQHLAATTRKQAERCLMHAVRALKYRPELGNLAITRRLEGFQQLDYGDNTWTVLASDPASSDGINGHVLADELHRWVGFEFFNTLRWALATQKEGLFVGITTAGSEMESVCRTLHDKTTAINDGHQTDQQFFGKVFSAATDDDPHLEETWKKANPSLGSKKHHPIKLSNFRADYEAAKNDPTQWPAWSQLRLNLWRTASDAWLPIEYWDRGDAERKKNKRKRIDCYESFTAESFDFAELNSVMAFDGATTRDTSAAVFTFEHPTDEGALLVLPFFWLPEARAEQLSDRVPYRQWAEQGFIKLTPGDAVDFTTIYQDLLDLLAKFETREFYFDPYFQAEWLTQKIEDETGIPRIEFRQTINAFSPCMKTAERMIIEKTLRHNGHPLLTWQFGNTRARSNANQDIRPDKQKHGDYRTIDGIVAMIMTMQNWQTVEMAGFYDDHEIEFI